MPSRVLPLDPMPSAAELRRMAAERGVLPSTMPQDAAKGAEATDTYRSGWEREYAALLDIKVRAGMIRRYAYEPDRLEIGVGARYKPDFKVWTDTGTIEYHEVKGYRREASIVRIKVAAKQYPQFRFVLVTKKDGQWHHQAIR
jgi:hypothetical protein